VLGANGAGKTTLLRCLAGLTPPRSGVVLWFGKSPQRHPELRRSIGMVAHQHWTYRELTPRENLLFAAQMYGLVDAVSRVEQLLAEADLQRNADQPTGQLSHGMRQRLSICRALVHDPAILLLDEPFSGLDDDGQQWLRLLLLQLQSRSRTICLSTHNRELADDLADCLFRLDKGKLRGETKRIHKRVLPESCSKDAA